ncbi:MAG: hypothetical protein GQ570_08485 [Helicobacteraceae bacterium]|nr:hypothetical protein [Helicobacteraceae bacterium]
MNQDKLLIVSNELERLGVFDSLPNSTADKMAKLLGDDIPYGMSLAIANYTMATFVGHFQYKIELSRDNLIPMNVIIFILAKSGAKKTSSMLKLEKSIKSGYQKIDAYRLEQAKQTQEEFDLPHPPYIPPLANALATEAGMIQRLNDFKKEGIGLPSLYVDEISTELSSNMDMIPNIKMVAQLFDVGDMKSKPLKDRKNQSEEVNGMGMNALFIGSEHGILEDASVLSKFETEFISKLARRSMFVYPKFKEEEEVITDIESILRGVKEKKEDGQELNQEINKLSSEIALRSINNDTNNMKLTEDCSRVYTIYTIYCESKVQDDVEAVVLEQQHRHWKALKLAGVYAVFNGNTHVTTQDLKEAIYVVEATGSNLGMFVEKANRLPYEILLAHYEEGGVELSVHDMVKKKWITKTSDVKNIVELANNKSGDSGMLEHNLEEGIITYQSFKKIEGLGVSYKKTENMQLLIDSGLGTREAKNKLASKTANGFDYKKTTFEKIGNLLRNDTAYAPFEFRNGIRGKDYIIGGADFIVLDVDDTDTTDTECADMLADYNYIIARGSDADNPYKYRVLLPLDVTVEIDNDKWKPFMKKVSEHLGINIDILPMAQFYFGYKDRELIINDEGVNLEASELVKNIEAKSPKIKALRPNQIGDAWDERMYLFSNAYNAKSGKGLHQHLWYAMCKAHDLGFSLTQGYSLLDDILDYLDDEPRAGYERTLKKKMYTHNGNFSYWVKEYKNAGLE